MPDNYDRHFVIQPWNVRSKMEVAWADKKGLAMHSVHWSCNIGNCLRFLLQTSNALPQWNPNKINGQYLAEEIIVCISVKKIVFGHFTEWFDWQYASGDLGNFWYQSGVNALLTWNNSIIHFITTVKCIYSAICSCPDQSIVGRVQGNKTRLFDKIVSYSATSKWRYVIFVKICGSCTVFTTLSWKISCQSRTQNNSMMCPISG